jgi:hypothetical protein
MLPFPTNHPTWIAQVYLLKFTERCRFQTTLYTIMVVPGGLYSKFLISVLEIRPAVSFRGFTARILCILLSSILLNNTEEHFKNRGKKIHKLYFRSMDDETKYCCCGLMADLGFIPLVFWHPSTALIVL